MLDVLHPQRIARANCDDRARPPGAPSSLVSCSCWGAHAARVLVSAARRDELQSTVLQSRVPPVTRHSSLGTRHSSLSVDFLLALPFVPGSGPSFRSVNRVFLNLHIKQTTPLTTHSNQENRNPGKGFPR